MGCTNLVFSVKRQLVGATAKRGGCQNCVRNHSRPPVLTFVSLCLFRRLTCESLAALEIPSDLLQTIQDLVLDLRVRCVVVTLQHTAEGVSRELVTSAQQQFPRTLPLSSPQILRSRTDALREM